jgi:hypothetical protein
MRGPHVLVFALVTLLTSSFLGCEQNLKNKLSPTPAAENCDWNPLPYENFSRSALTFKTLNVVQKLIYSQQLFLKRITEVYIALSSRKGLAFS